MGEGRRGGVGEGGGARGQAKLQALVYDPLPPEKGAGKRVWGRHMPRPRHADCALPASADSSAVE